LYVRRLFTEYRSSNLSRGRGVQSKFLAGFACLVILSETGIARHLHDRRRLYDDGKRSPGGLGRVDGRGGPVAEDDGPLLLPHGDMLGVVVPVKTESVELSLEFTDDGEYGGIVGGRCVVDGTEEGEGFVTEECQDFTPDEWSDG